MKLIFKILSLICFVLSSVIFSLTVFGINTLPDSIVYENTPVNSEYPFYTIQSETFDGQALTASTDLTEANGISQAQYSLLGLFPVKSVKLQSAQRMYVNISGEAFGLKLYSDGVLVVGTEEIETGEGKFNPAKDAGLQVGDIITEINGIGVLSNAQVSDIFQQCESVNVKMKIRRGGEEKEIDFTLVRSDGEGKRAGLWIRDSFAGIGTMTFYDSDSLIFGALGHAISDIDTGEIVPIISGEAVRITVDGCVKGSQSAAGELYGTFTDEKTGDLAINTESGIYGKLSFAPSDETPIPVATKQEIKTGAAVIRTTVDKNGPKDYTVNIIKLFDNEKSSTKNMVIEITDRELIEKTGGIVQGMSGSPIIQDGMFVGAVTHVFVNNPLQGYGIYAQNMTVNIKDSGTAEEKQAA